MKKTILLILALLPIVLLVLIAIATTIMPPRDPYVSVSGVDFCNSDNVPYEDDEVIKLEKGEKLYLNAVISPENASNKNKTYKSGDESICTVDENGCIIGVEWGETFVTVTTEDEKKTDKIYVNVTSENPVSIALSESKITMIEGEQKLLDAVVEPFNAKDKTVIFTSSNTGVVTVDSTGKLTAISVGKAVITATTKTGGLSATCEVTVVEGDLPIKIDLSGAEGVTFNNGFYVISSNTIDLSAYLEVGDGVSEENVVMKLQSGSRATLEDGILTFTGNGSVIVRAYDKTNPALFYDISIFYAQNRSN